MIIPVILFVCLTLALRESPSQEDFSNNNITSKNTSSTMVKVGEQSLIRFLLRN